jgi:uncharacterized protein
MSTYSVIGKEHRRNASKVFRVNRGSVATDPSTNLLPNGSTVTLVTQTRVRDEHSGDFARWQQHVNSVVANVPGFVAHEIIPPSPPVQPDWVIVQRFETLADAQAWLGSSAREQLLAEAKPWLLGTDDVHVFEDGEIPNAPRPVSALISTHVEPDRESAFRSWQQRMAAAQSRFPGFEGYRLEPPRPGVQDDWVTILRFDSEQHLNQWMESPERRKLIDEAAEFTAATRIRTARTGFDSWFQIGSESTSTPSAWKQNMVVLLALYPVVFAFGRWFEIPVLVEREGWVRWQSLFVSNVASVIILSLIVPRISNAFAWWLHPEGPDQKRLNLIGAALILALYGAWMLLFYLLH